MTEDETQDELEPGAEDELEPDALMALLIVGALAGKPLASFLVDDTGRIYTARKDPDWTGGAIFSLAQLYLRAATPAADVSVGDVAALSMRTAGAVSKVLEGWPRLEAGPPVAQDDSLSSLRLMGLSIADMVAVVDGVFGANAILAAVLESLGAESDDVARARKAGKRWLLWHRKEDGDHINLATHQSWAVKAVLRAAWARILAERERARARGVVSRVGFQALQQSVRVGHKRPELEPDGHALTVFGNTVAMVPHALVESLRPERLTAARRGAQLIATTAWNALIHMAAVGSSLRQRDGLQNPGLYRFDGIEGLARQLGLTSHKHRQALPDMLAFGEIYRFDLGDKFDPAALWAHRFERTGGAGQGRRIEVSVHPWVYGADVRQSTFPGTDKSLVFLSPQPAPLVVNGAPNLQAAQWAFWWQFHAALAATARAELCDTGAMTLDDDFWRQLADDAGWSERQKADLLPRLIARYTDDLVDQMLERVPGKRWVFKPGRALVGVAEGLTEQERIYRGAKRGGENRAKAHREWVQAGCPPRKKKRSK